MVVPTVTVTSAGVKLKLSIFTAASILLVPAVLAARPFWLPPPLSHASRSAAVIVRDLVVIFVLLKEGCSLRNAKLKSGWNQPRPAHGGRENSSRWSLQGVWPVVPS